MIDIQPPTTVGRESGNMACSAGGGSTGTTAQIQRQTLNGNRGKTNDAQMKMVPRATDAAKHPVLEEEAHGNAAKLDSAAALTMLAKSIAPDTDENGAFPTLSGSDVAHQIAKPTTRVTETDPSANKVQIITPNGDTSTTATKKKEVKTARATTATPKTRTNQVDHGGGGGRGIGGSGGNTGTTQTVSKEQESKNKSTNEVSKTHDKPLERVNQLGQMARRFLELAMSSKSRAIDLKQAAKTLGVKHRRIYDITNVLGGAGLTKKRSASVIEWKDEPYSKMKAGTEAQRKLLAEIGALVEEESVLDRWISELQGINQPNELRIDAADVIDATYRPRNGWPLLLRADDDDDDPSTQDAYSTATAMMTTLAIHAPQGSHVYVQNPNYHENSHYRFRIATDTDLDQQGAESTQGVKKKRKRLSKADNGNEQQTQKQRKSQPERAAEGGEKEETGVYKVDSSTAASFNNGVQLYYLPVAALATSNHEETNAAIAASTMRKMSRGRNDTSGTSAIASAGELDAPWSSWSTVVVSCGIRSIADCPSAALSESTMNAIGRSGGPDGHRHHEPENNDAIVDFDALDLEGPSDFF